MNCLKKRSLNTKLNSELIYSMCGKCGRKCLRYSHMTSFYRYICLAEFDCYSALGRDMHTYTYKYTYTHTRSHTHTHVTAIHPWAVTWAWNCQLGPVSHYPSQRPSCHTHTHTHTHTRTRTRTRTGTRTRTRTRTHA